MKTSSTAVASALFGIALWFTAGNKADRSGLGDSNQWRRRQPAQLNVIAPSTSRAITVTATPAITPRRTSLAIANATPKLMVSTTAISRFLGYHVTRISTPQYNSDANRGVLC